MNIELNPDDERFIAERIAAGRYRDASEVVHHAFEVLRKMKVELDAELLAGIDSGPAEPLGEDWKDRVRRDAAAKAESLQRKLA